MSRLNRGFFSQPTLNCARALLGKVLVRAGSDSVPRIAGLIVETEAYVTHEDLACHARVGRTRRNAVMWGPPGHAYVYFIYGMHWCLNFVTEAEGTAAAVLIRGVFPVEGLEILRDNRRGHPDAELANGPAKLTQAFKIDGSLNGLDLCDPESPIFVEDAPPISDLMVRTGPRIGLNRVPEPWKSLPWRFWVEGEQGNWE